MILRFAFYNLPFAFLLFLVAGCSSIPLPSFPWSSQPAQSNPTAEALFAEAMDHFNNKRYSRAIDRLQRFKAEFPFSPQLTEAELKLAEAYYLNKQYPETISAFKEFQTLHPTNENIPFVIYHLGAAHFDQFTSIDRDQKMTEIAKGYFETVARSYPNSPYAEKANEKLAKCNQYLAEHAFNIARFYFNDKNYPAARDRLEEILRRYPRSPTSPEALYYLGESYRLEKNSVKAALAYEALAQHYPESALAKQAQSQLAQLEKEKPDPLKLLLMSDRRPTLGLAQSPGSGEIQNPKPETQNSKELNLVAKKEVVHEEPGSERGVFRRVADTVNPLNWFSSSDGDEKSKAKQDGKTATAKAKQEKPKADPAKTRELLAKVDESLNQSGGDKGSQSPKAPKPPATELPKVSEEPAPPPTDPKAILAEIDAKLKKEGKPLDRLPPPPEAAPVFKAASQEAGKVGSSEASQPPSAPASQPTVSGIIADIDEALRRKGIEAPEPGRNASKLESQDATPPSGIPASQPSSGKKVELAPRLPTEKGPLFLDTGEFQVKTNPEETKEATKPKHPEAAQPAKTLPESLVKSPPQAQTVKPAEEKTAADTGEPKGALDQLKEDLQSVGRLLNPLNW